MRLRGETHGGSVLHSYEDGSILPFHLYASSGRFSETILKATHLAFNNTHLVLSLWSCGAIKTVKVQTYCD